MNKKQQQRTLKNRENLITAALQQFSTRGYHNTNIRNITQAAQLSTGVFYRYFDSKEALYQSANMLDQLLLTITEVSNKNEALIMLTKTLTTILARSDENIIFTSDIDIVEKELPSLTDVRIKGESLLYSRIEQFLIKQYPHSNMNYGITARMIHVCTDALGRDLAREKKLDERNEYINSFIKVLLYFSYDL